MTTATIEQELNRLGPDDDEVRQDPRTALYRCHLEALLSAARLREAIDGAERWYARREATLRGFDQRAAATVRQLVSDSRVRPSLVWSSR